MTGVQTCALPISCRLSTVRRKSSYRCIYDKIDFTNPSPYEIRHPELFRRHPAANHEIPLSGRVTVVDGRRGKNLALVIHLCRFMGRSFRGRMSCQVEKRRTRSGFTPNCFGRKSTVLGQEYQALPEYPRRLYPECLRLGSEPRRLG